MKSSFRKLRALLAGQAPGVENKLGALLALTNGQSQPNLNALSQVARDIDAIKLNIKFFGYDLARSLAEALPPRSGLQAQSVGITSKACTQADLESDWAAYWCAELKIALAFHRKVWEQTFVLQALFEFDVMKPGTRGVGFGCGEEPIASYLASRGSLVLVTDLPTADRQREGWAQTHQHVSQLEKAFFPHLVDEDAFRRNVALRPVDMNDIPDDLEGYDYCWSICALEHVGSIRQALDFIENAMSVLRPGGVAVHTTEFNCLNDEETIDNWPTVLLQRRHFQEIHARLTAKGHKVMPLNFDLGAGPVDKFIDLPPYAGDWSDERLREWGGHNNHLKLMIDGFACTCFGLIIVKG